MMRLTKYPELGGLERTISSFDCFHAHSLPLCAAENVMSEFVKLPLAADFQERYIMGSAYDYSNEDNFIGSVFLLPFYQQITTLCAELFHARYADVRTLTGMNCLCTIAMALMQPGERVMILDKEWGGHASVAPTLERLGLEVFYAPYCRDVYDFDYERLNRETDEYGIDYLMLAPSDIIFPMDLKRVDTSSLTLLYDASQLLGLIAAGLVANPLDDMTNCVVFGGTHKTMPGPAHGLILTNEERIFEKLDKNINPKYLRNTQMHQVVSLLFTLIEMKYFGLAYQANTVRSALRLGEALEAEGFTLAKKGNEYTRTHQLFIECSRECMSLMFRHAQKENITCNTKKKALFHGGFGVRLGLQEVSRYNWDNEALSTVSAILKNIASNEYNSTSVRKMMSSLPPKTIYFTFEREHYETLAALLACMQVPPPSSLSL